MNYQLKKIIRFFFNFFITKKMLVIIIAILLLLLLKSNVFAFDSLPSNTPTSSVTVVGNYPDNSSYENSVTITYPTAWAQYIDLNNIVVASPQRTFIYCPTSSNTFYKYSDTPPIGLGWTDCNIIFYHTYYNQWRLHHAGQNDFDQR